MPSLINRSLKAACVALVCLHLFSCGFEDKNVVKTLYTDGSLKSEAESVGGVYNGFYKHYRPDGSLDTLCYFKGGRKEGVCTTYYSFGKIHEAVSYHCDKKDGKAIIYDSMGNVKVIAILKNGKLNGAKKVFYPNGNIRWTADFLDGIMAHLTELEVNGDTVSNTYYIYPDLPDTLCFDNVVKFKIKTFYPLNAERYTAVYTCVPYQSYHDYLDGKLDRLPEYPVTYTPGMELTCSLDRPGKYIVLGSLNGYNSNDHRTESYLLKGIFYAK